MPLLGERHLARALRQCGRRCSTPGADGVSWAAYRRQAHTRIPELAVALRSGTWRPGPLRERPFLTYTGKRLPCVIPTVEDRIVHRAMRNIIEPILEERAFADWVSGYRRHRNRITALRQAMTYAAAGLTWVADVDVEEVSYGSDAREVTNWLARYIQDGSFLDRVHTALAGLPFPIVPGAGLSPLLINLRLVPADEKLADLPVVRFADNYCAFAADRRGASAALDRFTAALVHIGMRPNADKSRIRETGYVEDLFLIGG